jgi:hypothetical protein
LFVLRIEKSALIALRTRETMLSFA